MTEKREEKNMAENALQIELKSSAPINVGAKVPFTSIATQLGSITYDSGNQKITLSEAGVYLVNWWLATQSSASSNGAVFALTSSQGDYLIGDSPIKAGEVCGVAVIHVTAPPVTLSLVNTGTAPVYLAGQVPLQGSLAVTEENSGSVGPTGPAPAGIIAFYAGYIDSLSTDSEGKPQRVALAGFESTSSNQINLQPGDWDAGTITFIPRSTSNTGYGCSFLMPYNATVKSLYVLFGIKSGFYLDTGTNLRPFAALASLTADIPGNRMIYTILPGTLTYTEPIVGITNQEFPVYTLKRGESTNISVNIPAGTLVTIVLGFSTEGIELEQYRLFAISGGILLE